MLNIQIYYSPRTNYFRVRPQTQLDRSQCTPICCKTSRNCLLC